MCRENLLKIAMVEFSMVFLAATLNGVTAQEEKKAHTSISVEHIEVQEPVVYAVHDDYEEQPHVAILEEPEVTARTFSQEEEELLLQIAMAEAEGEPTEGKAMVMMVVLNRTNSDDFPDSIGEVIFQDGQFAVMEENGRFYTTVPNEDCYRALELVESGWDESNGALYFESSKTDGWHARNLEFLFAVGEHRFYK